MARPRKNKEIEILDKNLEIEKKEQNSIRNLEQFYVEGKVDTMLQEIDENKEKLVGEMIEYAKKCEIECKWDKEGDPIDWKIDLNPIVISNKFFKPIVPIGCQEPMYNAEKLSLVFEYYNMLLAEVNDKIGHFPSSLTLFCKFSGLTLSSLRRLKQSDDYNMRIIVEKIYDQIGDENITMAQMGIAKERSTLFKMKSQNEITEKVQPNVNINANIVDVDFDRIQERLSKYSNYTSKKK